MLWRVIAQEQHPGQRSSAGTISKDLTSAQRFSSSYPQSTKGLWVGEGGYCNPQNRDISLWTDQRQELGSGQSSKNKMGLVFVAPQRKKKCWVRMGKKLDSFKK